MSMVLRVNTTETLAHCAKATAQSFREHHEGTVKDA